jgi:hypothetical protein
VTVSTRALDTVRASSQVEHEEARMDEQHSGGYLSRVVDLPVAVAEPVFDDVTRLLGQSAVPHASTIGTALLPARTIRTRLGSAIPGAGVSVDVELAPWSRSRTEVAVRYAGNRHPRALARYVYDKRAPELLADVAGAIDARLPGSRERRRAA